MRNLLERNANLLQRLKLRSRQSAMRSIHELFQAKITEKADKYCAINIDLSAKKDHSRVARLSSCPST
jgi:hypothetical protein